MSSLPERERRIIDKYFHIRFGSFELPCPYFINKRNKRLLSPVEAGKGAPEEIEAELLKWLGKFSKPPTSAEEALNMVRLLGIGVDCSGFVVNVLDLGGRVKYPDFISRLRAALRPRSNISADLLTGPFNSRAVEISEVRPGDLIKPYSSHVMLVEGVEGGRISYVHSSLRTGGVERGEIQITNADKTWEFRRLQ